MLTYAKRAKSNSTKRHYIEWYLPFYMLLCQYKIGIVDLGTIGLAIVMFLNLLQYGSIRSFKGISKSYAVLWAYILIRDVAKVFVGIDDNRSLVNNMISYSTIFLLVLLVCSFDFDENTLYKAWKYAGLIYSLGLLYHVVMLYVFDVPVQPITLFGDPIRDVYSQDRPSSFFPEPASFATVMLPLEYLSLKRNDYKTAFLTTLMILLSTSSVGVILSLVLWACTLVISSIRSKYKFTLIISMSLIIILFLNVDVFTQSLDKLLDVTQGESTFGTRVVSGFEIIGSVDKGDAIFGTSYNQVKTYIMENWSMLSNAPTVRRYYLEKGDVFLNTFSDFYFRYGIVGDCLYFLPMIKRFFTKKYQNKPYVLMVLLSVFAQSSILNSIFFMTAMLLILLDNQKRCDEEI